MATKVFLTKASSSPWTVPSDFGSLVSVECLGGAGSGNGASTGSGGGGSAYAAITSTTTPLIAGVTTINFGVGAGGAPPSGSTGADGTATWWNATSLSDAVTQGSAKSCAADFGRGGVAATAGAGGLAANSVGTTKFDGGSGNRGTTTGAGGGSGGPDGAGQTAPGAAGGFADGSATPPGTPGGTSGNPGVSGTQFDPTHGCGSGAGHEGAGNGKAGGQYGGGGAAGSFSSTGGVGGDGLIVITYNAVTPLTGRATAMAASRGSGTFRLALAAQGEAQAKAKMAGTFRLALISRMAAVLQGREVVPQGTVPVSGRLSDQAKAAGTVTGAATLRSAMQAQAKSRAAAPAGIVSLAARMASQAKILPVLSATGTAVALIARSAMTMMGRATPSGTVGLVGKGAAQAKTVFRGATLFQFLLARSIGQVKGRMSAPSVAGHLAARITSAVTGRGQSAGTVKVAGLGAAKTKGLAQTRGASAISGRAAGASKGRAGPLTPLALESRIGGLLKAIAVLSTAGSINLAGRARFSMAGRGVLSIFSNMRAVSGAAKAMSAGRGTLSRQGTSITKNGCILLGRAAKAFLTGQASRAIIHGRACECDDMNIHRPETFTVGDTWELQGTLTYADGSPFNLAAGCNILWAIENSGGTVVLELSLGSGIEVLDATAGTCLVTVLPSQSDAVPVGIYTDQLQATDPTGYVSTQWQGVVNANATFF